MVWLRETKYRSHAWNMADDFSSLEVLLKVSAVNDLIDWNTVLCILFSVKRVAPMMSLSRGIVYITF